MKITIVLLALLPLLACKNNTERPSAPATSPAAVQPVPAAAAGPAQLAPENKPNPLPGGGWFTWKFSEKPKLGTIIVKVQVFGKDGGRETPYEIIGESGMPSMPYHDSGPVKFQLNKKGDYLLPVDIVMTGEWSVLIRVKQENKEIYAGKVLFSL